MLKTEKKDALTDLEQIRGYEKWWEKNFKLKGRRFFDAQSGDDEELFE